MLHFTKFTRAKLPHPHTGQELKQPSQTASS